MSACEALELRPANAAAYLRSRRIAGEVCHVRELGGGVSNTVLLVETATSRLILKQALGRLRVEQEWLSDRSRVFRESAALRALAPYFPLEAIPRVLFEDRENFCFAMTAAAAGARPWKELLLEGMIRPETAEQVAQLLARMLAASWRRPEWERQFGDQTVFNQLRLDPYYRVTAARHPDLAGRFAALMDASARRRVSLVHGDWSPKNLLVDRDRVTAIDFEVIHYGDPAFDTAFLLNHLLMKSVHRPEWRAQYAACARRFWHTLAETAPVEDWLERATIEHLGCLLLARVDGKSPAEYLRAPELQDRARRLARRIITDPPRSIDELFSTTT